MRDFFPTNCNFLGVLPKLRQLNQVVLEQQVWLESLFQIGIRLGSYSTCPENSLLSALPRGDCPSAIKVRKNYWKGNFDHFNYKYLCVCVCVCVCV
jgi:hypothetical protein